MLLFLTSLLTVLVLTNIPSDITPSRSYEGVLKCEVGVGLERNGVQSIHLIVRRENLVAEVDDSRTRTDLCIAKIESGNCS